MSTSCLSWRSKRGCMSTGSVEPHLCSSEAVPLVIRPRKSRTGMVRLEGYEDRRVQAVAALKLASAASQSTTLQKAAM